MARTRRKKFTEEEKVEAERQIEESARRVDFYITEYSVELLAKKLKDGEYYIPEYQRNFVWEEQRKSKFIESVIMGLPIPFLFFWEDPETGRFEIVDGSQRLRTLKEFIYDGMVLQQLEELDLINGMTFEDLSLARKRKVNNRSIRGIVLSQSTDQATRLDMFERINTGSLGAQEVEIRRGALAGPFMDLIIELSENSLLKELAPVSRNKAKLREYEELVTRFFAYSDAFTSENGFEGYRDKPARFHFYYVRRMNAAFLESPELAEEYRDRFEKMLVFVERVFPEGFRKGPNAKTTPRVRFESISVGSFLAYTRDPELYSLAVADFGDLREWLDSIEYRKIVTSDGANSKRLLLGRVNVVAERLLGSRDG